MTQDVKVQGEEIVLAGVTYVLPPLPLVKLSKVKTLMQGGNINEDTYVNSLCDAICWSLNRNYPDLKKEEVSDNLDMTNFQQILDAFMSVNGFIKKPKDEQAGEVTAS